MKVTTFNLKRVGVGSARGRGMADDYDVVVVGFGGAGVCAAIEAAEAGCRVLALDRYYGGGSTDLSGGVVYAGGGTSVQRDAGVQDTPRNMLAYLRREVGGVVSEETLAEFARTSPEMIEWLERHGVEFKGTLCGFKTSYPTNRHHLYYSGNEGPYRDTADPAPRGHRAYGRNFAGTAFYRPLREAALRAGVELRTLCEVTDLVVEDGRVSGVRYAGPNASEPAPAWHRRLHGYADKMHNWAPPVGTALGRLVGRTGPARTAHTVRAGGVVLAGGGFSRNEAMLSRYAPHGQGLVALSAGADDGSAIELGQRAGGALGHMSNLCALRFVSPPSAFSRGVLVDRAGQRICNEQLYGATMGNKILLEHDRKAYLILDHAVWQDAKAGVWSETAFFHKPQLGYLFSPAGHVRGESLATVARRLGIDADALERTVSTYNGAAEDGRSDPLGKQNEARTPLRHGPFYAIDCSADASPAFPFLFFTIGGLVVDERSGGVLGPDGTSVPGLYAAGRSAVGLCSASYVSGLSLADCVFSGRRAGRSLAAGTRTAAARGAGQ